MDEEEPQMNTEIDEKDVFLSIRDAIRYHEEVKNAKISIFVSCGFLQQQQQQLLIIPFEHNMKKINYRLYCSHYFFIIFGRSHSSDAYDLSDWFTLDSFWIKVYGKSENTKWISHCSSKTLSRADGRDRDETEFPDHTRDPSRNTKATLLR